MKPNVLVCGYTGSGKTSLLQAFCGESVVPEDAIGHGEPETFDFHAYESDDVRFHDSRGMELGDREEEFLAEIRTYVRRHQVSDHVDEHVHLLWYCIAGDRARVTATDRSLIAHLFPTTIVVVTKNDIMRPQQREGITRELLDAGVAQEDLVFVSADERSGLDQLLQRTVERMPEALQAAFESLLDLRREEFRARCDRVAEEAIRQGVWRSVRLALLPLPVIDLALIADNQRQMIQAIGAAYGYATTREDIDRFIKTIGIGTAALFVTKFLLVLRAPVAAEVTLGLGRAAREWFASNMTVPDAELRRIYNHNKTQVGRRQMEVYMERDPEPGTGGEGGATAGAHGGRDGEPAATAPGSASADGAGGARRGGG